MDEWIITSVVGQDQGFFDCRLDSLGGLRTSLAFIALLVGVAIIAATEPRAAKQ